MLGPTELVILASLVVLPVAVIALVTLMVGRSLRGRRAK
jgi:hypothetical protein